MTTYIIIALIVSLLGVMYYVYKQGEKLARLEIECDLLKQENSILNEQLEILSDRHNIDIPNILREGKF